MKAYGFPPGVANSLLTYLARGNIIVGCILLTDESCLCKILWGNNTWEVHIEGLLERAAKAILAFLPYPQKRNSPVVDGRVHAMTYLSRMALTTNRYAAGLKLPTDGGELFALSVEV